MHSQPHESTLRAVTPTARIRRTDEIQGREKWTGSVIDVHDFFFLKKKMKSGDVFSCEPQTQLALNFDVLFNKRAWNRGSERITRLVENKIAEMDVNNY